MPKHETHDTDPRLTDVLTNLRCVATTKVNGNTLTVYATKGGLVAFLDYKRTGGWTVLTECPALGVQDNVAEIRAVIEGTAAPRKGV